MNVLKTQYTDFNGRANRPQYWYFALFTFIISLVLGIIDGLLFGTNILSLIFVLAILVPSIGLGVRRIHDLGYSGWWYLISMVPFVGGIALLVAFCLKGQDKTNAYGNPVA